MLEADRLAIAHELWQPFDQDGIECHPLSDVEKSDAEKIDFAKSP